MWSCVALTQVSRNSRSDGWKKCTSYQVETFKLWVEQYCYVSTNLTLNVWEKVYRSRKVLFLKKCDVTNITVDNLCTLIHFISVLQYFVTIMLKINFRFWVSCTFKILAIRGTILKNARSVCMCVFMHVWWEKNVVILYATILPNLSSKIFGDIFKNDFKWKNFQLYWAFWKKNIICWQ